jgi:hypothetical protein
MRVKLLSTCAGPQGVYHPGLHDFPDDEARALIAGGFAVSAEPEIKTEPARPPTVERATAPEPEAAAIRPSRRTVVKPKDL